MKFSLIRFLKERRLRHAFEPLRARLQEELSAFLKQRCLLVPARGKGGYDRLYYVDIEGRRIAIMRVKNEQADQAVAATGNGLRRVLNATERLDHEWAAYSVLSPKGLSPQPVWRTSEAIVSTYHPFKRASEMLRAGEEQVWDLIPLLFALVRGMHAEKMVHMDLNLGNVLIDPFSCRALAIDFEYAPSKELTFEQACLCDYCRIINDLLRPRRGGRTLRKELQRFLDMLRREWPPSTRWEDVVAVRKYFPNLMKEEPVLRALEAFSSPNSK